jgi:hypothetical protein
MADGQLISFQQYAPDLASISANVTTTATNVIPRLDGYGPFPSLAALTAALPFPARGIFFARNPDSSAALFAGIFNQLYKLNNTTFAWENVSKAAGTYPLLPSTDNWQFVQFDTNVIAVQANVVPQVFDLTTPTLFVDLGTPVAAPNASHVAVVNRFLVLSGILNHPFRVQWSDLDDIQAWAVGVGTLASFQDLPDGGIVHDIRGGDQYGIIFQDQAIRSLIWAPGSPETFDILRIATQDGIYGQYSSVTAGDRIFFYSPQGFKTIVGGGYPKPIGKQRVDVTFQADLDQSSLRLFIAATDPMSTRVYWQYKSKFGNANFADKILVYDWALGDDGQWSIIEDQQIEMLSFMGKPGLTLEGVDATATTSMVNVLAAESGGGVGPVIRLTVVALPPPFAPATVTIYGITAGAGQCVEANSGPPNSVGAWPFTVASAVAPFKIDLVGSTFIGGHTGTAGGKFGGSLDALGYSLDAVSIEVTLRLAAFNSNHQLGFFSGPNLEAVINTPNQDLGSRLAILWMRPLTDAAGCFGSIAKLDTAQSAQVFSTENVVNAEGLIPQRVETRYAAAQLRIPAGVDWKYATGVKAPDALGDQGDR